MRAIPTQRHNRAATAVSDVERLREMSEAQAARLFAWSVAGLFSLVTLLKLLAE